MCPECGTTFAAEALGAAPRVPSLGWRVASILFVVAIGSAVGFANAETGIPRWYATFSAVNIFPVFFLGWSLSMTPIACGSTALALSLPVLRRSPRVHWSVVVIASLVAIIDLWWFVVGFDFALHYHGQHYTVAVTLLNMLFAACLGAVLVLNRRRPRFSTLWIFHALLAMWVTGWAAPYLAELP